MRASVRHCARVRPSRLPLCENRRPNSRANAMNDSADQVAVALTALLPALLIIAALLALPVSLALLARS